MYNGQVHIECYLSYTLIHFPKPLFPKTGAFLVVPTFRSDLH